MDRRAWHWEPADPPLPPHPQGDEAQGPPGAAPGQAGRARLNVNAANASAGPLHAVDELHDDVSDVGEALGQAGGGSV